MSHQALLESLARNQQQGWTLATLTVIPTSDRHPLLPGPQQVTPKFLAVYARPQR